MIALDRTILAPQATIEVSSATQPPRAIVRTEHNRYKLAIYRRLATLEIHSMSQCETLVR